MMKETKKKNYHCLSSELQRRIIEDRNNHVINEFAFSDDNIVRRNPNHDRANLWRPAFVRDTEKIMNIPYFSRYSDKTQVFSLFKNDDISRRSYHVQLVSRIARNIGKALGLNLDLIEAISLGHDIGHTPFGHAGERVLSSLYHQHTGKYFNHNVHSVRVLDGIFQTNLSLQTLDGIICHNGEIELAKYEPVSYSSFDIFDQKVNECLTDNDASKRLVPATLEACVMRVSDIIAYLGKDRQDALKLGVINGMSGFKTELIGNTHAEIINNMIVNIIENSYGKPFIKMGEEYYEAFSLGKKENYSLIYNDLSMKKLYEEQINPMFEKLYEYIRNEVIKIKNGNGNETITYKHHVKYINGYTGYYSQKDYAENDIDDIVVDYLASMTDDYFVDFYKHVFPNDENAVGYVSYF